MRLAGSHIIGASRELVWQVVTEPQIVQSCVPGLDELEIVEAGRLFRGTVKYSLGPNQLLFPTAVEWLELETPRLARLRAETAFAGTTIEVASRLELFPLSADQTLLDWDAEIGLSGHGENNRFVLQMVNMMANKALTSFFDCVVFRLEGDRRRPAT
jgi:carbon monoxide dehydrogenase subunit G